MIDEETAQAAINHLVTAMAELMEDALAEGFGRTPSNPPWGKKFAELGGDLAKLSAAVEVLIRRASGNSMN